MENSGKIFLGVTIGIVVVGSAIGVGMYIKNKNDKEAYEKSIRTTAQDFDNTVMAFNKIGSDVFMNASPEFMQNMKSLMLKNLVKQQVYDLIVLINKGEKNWSPAEKTRFERLMQFWKGQ